MEKGRFYRASVVLLPSDAPWGGYIFQWTVCWSNIYLGKVFIISAGALSATLCIKVYVFHEVSVPSCVTRA